MTNPVPAAQPSPPSVAASASPAPATTSPGALGPDAFLKLLVAQLEYQDPMSPADPTQFLAETAQFTQVQSLNTLTTQSSSSLAASQDTTAAALLGRWVQAKGTGGHDITGIVSGLRLTSSGPILEVGTTDTPLATVTEVLPQAPGSTTATKPA